MRSLEAHPTEPEQTENGRLMLELRLIEASQGKPVMGSDQTDQNDHRSR